MQIQGNKNIIVLSKVHMPQLYTCPDSLMDSGRKIFYLLIWILNLKLLKLPLKVNQRHQKQCKSINHIWLWLPI